MTINTAQGQTLDRVGIYLPDPVFAHGQLYVAFSRARSTKDVAVHVVQAARQGTFNRTIVTDNVVYREIL
jgi:ATP-dependent exoDNAse (exonuclease V) alpha subunit